MAYCFEIAQRIVKDMGSVELVALNYTVEGVVMVIMDRMDEQKYEITIKSKTCNASKHGFTEDVGDTLSRWHLT